MEWENLDDLDDDGKDLIKIDETTYRLSQEAAAITDMMAHICVQLNNIEKAIREIKK